MDSESLDNEDKIHRPGFWSIDVQIKFALLNLYFYFLVPIKIEI